MASKRTNVLREYHLLIKREADGFEWQIRYDRHANPVQRSSIVHTTHSQAAIAGEDALTALKCEIAQTAEIEHPSVG